MSHTPQLGLLTPFSKNPYLQSQAGATLPTVSIHVKHVEVLSHELHL